MNYCLYSFNCIGQIGQNYSNQEINHILIMYCQFIYQLSHNSLFCYYYWVFLLIILLFNIFSKCSFALSSTCWSSYLENSQIYIKVIEQQNCLQYSVIKSNSNKAIQMSQKSVHQQNQPQNLQQQQQQPQTAKQQSPNQSPLHRQQSDEQQNQQNQQQKASKENSQQKQNDEIQLSRQNNKYAQYLQQNIQIPTDKTQLIKYLSCRIKQAQDVFNSTENLLDEEAREWENLSKSLDQRNQQLSKLYQISQRGLNEKIEQKLNEILNMTVSQKMQSEQQLAEQKQNNYEYKCRYTALEESVKEIQFKMSDQSSKVNQLDLQIMELNEQNKSYEDQIDNYRNQYGKIKQDKQNLENKYLQMKVALDRMSDIKGVLNRFFGNEDLFDQKMQLKEQKIIKRIPLNKEYALPPPSREKKSGKIGNNATRLKPLVIQKNDETDFWKADFKDKNYLL